MKLMKLAASLKKKSQALRARHTELIELGVTMYIRRASAIYTDARALRREMDDIEEDLEVSDRASIHKPKILMLFRTRVHVGVNKRWLS